MVIHTEQISNTKERLLLFLQHLNLSQGAFERKCGISNGYINNIRTSIGNKILEKIEMVYPELNKLWLLHGDGPMIKHDGFITKDERVNYTKSPSGRVTKKFGAGLVKFYDTDFAAGDIQFFEDSSSIIPAYEMDIPEFAGCTAFRTYGESMEPMIQSGSILFGTLVEDWQSHLEYGQIYGIVCNDKRKYLKYIRKDRERPQTHYLLRSENKEYDDFELPKDKIKNIWLIHGWINKRT